MISLIIPTYNRANVLPRAIESVLTQDYEEWELIVVDDGSVDDTKVVLSSYNIDSRIKVVYHQNNLGVTAAINTGLDLIKGEWFTVLGSDDEIIPTAFSKLLMVHSAVDNTIDAITCNCIDTQTGEFSGKGLDRDQYLDAETVTNKCRGEFWGLTRTSLLGNLRFNEKLRGWENTLWSKIDQRARRYYIHQALRIYHTEGNDRLSEYQQRNYYAEANLYSELFENEKEYLGLLKKWDPATYQRILFKACNAFIITGSLERARLVYKELRGTGSKLYTLIAGGGFVFGPEYLYILQRLISALRKVR